MLKTTMMIMMQMINEKMNWTGWRWMRCDDGDDDDDNGGDGDDYNNGDNKALVMIDGVVEYERVDGSTREAWTSGWWWEISSVAFQEMQNQI